jgi:hypothetical protein
MDTVIINNKNNKKNKNIQNNININKSKIYIHNNDVHNLYRYSTINPSFFKKIIIQDLDLSEEDLKKLYNMCLLNGTIYFPEKYNNFFKNKRMIIKKNNYIYPIIKRTVDFIIIGAQKAGTTALSLNISKHPDIIINNNKNPTISEVHYFDLNWKKGIEWYRKELKYYSKENKLIGEKTPDLIYLPNIFPLIQSVNPCVKLIIILRNPVLRAYSHWKMNIKNNLEDLSFNKAIEYELKYLKDQNRTFHSIGKHYLNKGYYYKQIKELIKWFPLQNILVLISENVKENMNNEYNKVYNFLNLKELKNSKYELEYISDDTTEINQNIYNELIKLFKNDISKLEKLFNIKTNWL